MTHGAMTSSVEPACFIVVETAWRVQTVGKYNGNYLLYKSYK